MNLARHLLRQDVPVGIIGMDESPPQYVAKLCSAVTGVNHETIEDQWGGDLGRSMRAMYRQKARLVTISKGHRPTSEVLSAWLEMAEVRPRVVFIDYLSLLVREKYAGNDVQRIPRLVEDMKQWTHEEEMVTVVLHQVGQGQSENRYHGDTPMNLEMLKFGGGDDADVVMATYRPAKDPVGNMRTFEDAVAWKGDNYKLEYWQRAVERVEKYRTSTFLQLLKNRPGTRINEQGIELRSWKDSQRMYSEKMGQPLEEA
jgi:hypothetical protein